MTTRSAIGNTRYPLIYTEELGWIDEGHANGEGAAELYNQIKNEGKGTPWNGDNYSFCIEYYQDMETGNKRLHTGFTTFWVIKKGLTKLEQKSIALAIFMYVSFGFEAHQSIPPQSFILDSGFSCEDLISNLLGFYRRIEPANYDFLMKKYPKEYAYKIWDHYGPVGNFKNNEFRVLYFPNPTNSPNAVPYKKPLPLWLSKIPIINLSRSDKVKLIHEYQFYGTRVNNTKYRFFMQQLYDDYYMND